MTMRDEEDVASRRRRRCRCRVGTRQAVNKGQSIWTDTGAEPKEGEQKEAGPEMKWWWW